MPERRASQLSAGGTHELLIAGLQSLLVRLPPAHDRMLPAAARGPRRRSVPHTVDPGSASGPHHVAPRQRPRRQEVPLLIFRQRFPSLVVYGLTNGREEVVVVVAPLERRYRVSVGEATKHTGHRADRNETRLR